MSALTQPPTENGTDTHTTTSGVGTLAAAAAAASSIFSLYSPATPLQHSTTHLSYASSPSLTGELLRQAASEYLRTQVLLLTQLVVLYGFNDHTFGPKDD